MTTVAKNINKSMYCKGRLTVKHVGALVTLRIVHLEEVLFNSESNTDLVYQKNLFVTSTLHKMICFNLVLASSYTK